jgi:prolyl-tRNA synthetase
MALVDTPYVKTIEELAKQNGLPIRQIIKTVFVRASAAIDSDIIALIIRGDHELNEIKAEKLAEVSSPLEIIEETEI